VELNEYEIKSLEEISKWEKEKQEGFHKKILDVITKPVDYLIKKIGPEKLKMFESAIEATIKQMLYASTYTVNPQQLIKRAHEHGIMIEDLSEMKTCNLELLDDCNRKHIKFHERASAVQGAAAGIGGGLVATVDLTAVLVQDFHMLQEIAFCYGYDPNDIIEKEIILRIIEAGVGGSEAKFKALQEIENLKRLKDEKTETEATGKGISVVGAKALEEYIEDLAVSLLGRLIPRTLPIPVATMVISAHSNHEIMEHSGNTAFMVYRKRFIERKKEL